MGRWLDVGKKGVSFQDVVKKIEQQYRKKGYSKKRAHELAVRTAGRIYWRKFGRKKGSRYISEALRRRNRAMRRRR